MNMLINHFIIACRAYSKQDPCATKPWATPGWRLGVVGPPAGPLLAPFSFHIGNNSRKFLAQSEKLPRTTFLKQKDSRKQELALGILLIG